MDDKLTLGDAHEHPLFQTDDFRGRSRNEQPDHGRARVSIRAAIAPASVGDLFCPECRHASMADLV